MEEENLNIFSKIETTESPSSNLKEAVFSELEIIQNASQVIEHFLGHYFNVLTEAFKK
jgi:hypothetical protein